MRLHTHTGLQEVMLVASNKALEVQWSVAINYPPADVAIIQVSPLAQEAMTWVAARFTQNPR